MGAFIVERAQHKKPVEGRNGPMQVIALWLRDGEGQAPTEAEWFTRADTPVPAAGSTLEGTLELGEYGFKFKKTNRGNGGGPGQRGDLSPEAQARIDATGRAQGRAHAHEMALRYADIKSREGAMPAGWTKENLLPLIEWFYNDAQAAKEQKP